MNIGRLRSRWLLALSSLLALLGLAEGTLRLYPGTLPAHLRQVVSTDPGLGAVAHPYIGHLNKPGSHTDPYGFRNEWPWPDSPGIITLGDSATLGSGVDASAAWPGLLASAFPEWGVLNLALAAAGPQQYLRVYETYGADLRPRLILIGFFARNDFRDAAMFENWLKSGAGGNYLVWRATGRPANVRLSLRRPMGKLVRSGLWRGELVARKTYLGNLLLHTAGRSMVWTPSGIEVYEAPDGTRLELLPEDFFSATVPAYRGNQVFARVLASVRRIDSLARRNGARAAVVFLPSKEEVYLPLLRGPFPDPTALLRAALDELGIPSLDLLNDFRRLAATGEVLFNPVDSQLPNERGHALIAALVISHLRQHAEQYALSRAAGAIGGNQARHRQSARP